MGEALLQRVGSPRLEMTDRGPKSLLEIFASRYADIVRHVTRRHGRDADAEDVVQDAYLRARETPPDAEIRNPLAYALRMADNLAIDHLRRRRAQGRRIMTGVEADAEDDRPDAHEVLEQRARLARLEQAIRDLPDRQREAFLLHKFDGLSHSEVAARLGISRSGVEKLVMKALAQCRDRVDGPPD